MYFDYNFLSFSLWRVGNPHLYCLFSFIFCPSKSSAAKSSVWLRQLGKELLLADGRSTYSEWTTYNPQVSVWIHSDRQKKRRLAKERTKTDIPEGWTSWMAYTLLRLLLLIKIIKSYPVYCWYILNVKFRWHSRLIKGFWGATWKRRK